MKAYICREFGPIESHNVEEIEDPTAGQGQVVVDVKAAGVAFPDVLIVQGLYQFKPPFPFVPGGEIAGIVSSIGEGVTKWKVGDRIIGTTGFAGLAEKAVYSENQLMPLPESMDFQTGAIFPLNYGTTYHALKQRANIQSGESLLVLGAGGGIGMTAIHLGKALGARVIAAASSQEKLDLCKREGADEVLLYPSHDMSREEQKLFSEEIKNISGGGVDVVYDVVGGDYAEPSLRAINWKGRYLVIGFTSNIPKIPLNLALLKGCQIVGVFWGHFTGVESELNAHNFQDLFLLHAQGKIKPFISETFKIEDTAKAIKLLQDRKVLGKVVVSME